jgi:glutathione S-transferase
VSSTASLRLWTIRTSPYAAKPRAAFAEKGVPIELVEIHPVRRPPRLRELNPLNRVPVLETGGAAIRESSVILEWIEETYPDPPLWPADPTARAEARAWAKFIDDSLLTNLFLGLRKASFGRDEDDPEDIVERLHARVPRQWPRLEAALAPHEGPWLMGEQFTYADLGAMPLAVRLPEWAPQLAPDAGDYPLVAAWLEALRERPSAEAIDAAGAEKLEA